MPNYSRTVLDRDLTYDYVKGAYTDGTDFDVIQISSGAFLKGGYVNPNLVSVNFNNIPFKGNSMASTFRAQTANSSNLTTVTGINTYTTNMVNAFANCRKLESIDAMPNSVINMMGCFYNCQSLTNVPSLPNSVTDISEAYMGCFNLTSVPNMPDSVTRAVEAYYCANHFSTPPKLSNNLNPSYGLSRTFYFTNITDIPVIPNSITDLYMTFTQCSALGNMYSSPNRQISNSVTNMFLTFAACFDMTYPPTLPNHVEVLYSTFAKCFSLRSAPIIPNTVKNMAGTFYQCYNLNSAPTLPEGLETLGEGGHDIYPLHQYGAGCFSCTNISTSPSIPNTVVNMSGCFGDCHNLNSMPVIPYNVNDMGTCFINCNTLTNTKAISTNVTNIADCFAGCSNLVTAPVIPRNVTRITGEFFDGLFSRCTNLTGDIYIMSNKITNAVRTFANTSLSKNVYIPFRKGNGTYSDTYKAFINAGYSETVAKDGAILHDASDYRIFSINLKQKTAEINIEYNDITISGIGSLMVVLPKDTVVNYTVTCLQYPYVEETITLTEDFIWNGSLDDGEVRNYSVSYDNNSGYAINTTAAPDAICITTGTTRSIVDIPNDFVVVENQIEPESNEEE